MGKPGFRVYLEGLSDKDIGPLAKNADDYEIAYNVAPYGTFPHPYTRADAVSFIQSSRRAELNRTGYHFGIHASDTNEFIGAAGVLSIDEDVCCAIGFWIGKEHRGKGYSKEAVSLLLYFSFDYLDAREVLARTFAFNGISIKLLTGMGFERDERYTNMVPHYNGYTEEQQYRMLKKVFSERYSSILTNVQMIV